MMHAIADFIMKLNTAELIMLAAVLYGAVVCIVLAIVAHGNKDNEPRGGCGGGCIGGK